MEYFVDTVGGPIDTTLRVRIDLMPGMKVFPVMDYFKYNPAAHVRSECECIVPSNARVHVLNVNYVQEGTSGMPAPPIDYERDDIDHGLFIWEHTNPFLPLIDFYFIISVPGMDLVYDIETIYDTTPYEIPEEEKQTIHIRGGGDRMTAIRLTNNTCIGIGNPEEIIQNYMAKNPKPRKQARKTKVRKNGGKSKKNKCGRRRGRARSRPKGPLHSRRGFPSRSTRGFAAK